MLSFFTSVLSDASVRLSLGLRGKYIGTDALGNRYYVLPARRGNPRERRLVLYAGASDASKIPAEWHGWMHHQTDTVPPAQNPLRRFWQKQHMPNMTGSANAYVPPGHAARGGHRAGATGDYESWAPPQ
jgi:NADH:ubiquinone oxidoreductase subunit